MDGIESRMEGTKLILTIDVSPAIVAKARPSKSGKCNIVATSSGAQPVPGVKGVTWSLNILSK